MLPVLSVEGVEASPHARKPHRADASRHRIRTADMLQSTMNRFEPRWTFGRRTMAAALLLLVGSASTFAQQDVNVNVNVHVDLGNATHLVMPQTRAWDIRHPRRPVRESGVQIESVSANVSIQIGRAHV